MTITLATPKTSPSTVRNERSLCSLKLPTASPIWDFTSECPVPGAPVVVTPADGSKTTDTTPYFDWLVVSGASSYQIEVDDNSDFTSPEIDTVTLDLEYEPTLPLSLGSYSWRVLAANSCGDGPWSPTRSLTLVARIYLPTVLRNNP